MHLKNMYANSQKFAIPDRNHRVSNKETLLTLEHLTRGFKGRLEIEIHKEAIVANLVEYLAWGLKHVYL